MRHWSRRTPLPLGRLKADGLGPRKGPGTVFIARRPRGAVKPEGGDGGTRRIAWIPIAVFLVLVCVAVGIPVYVVAGADYAVWAVAGGVVLAMAAAYVAGVRIRARGEDARMGRLEYLSGHISSLCDSLPRKTDVETLAVLHEIRICYDEACALADGFGERGGRLAATLHKSRGRIDKMYEIQSGFLRRTEANAAEFAEAMRGLGRNADGSERR